MSDDDEETTETTAEEKPKRKRRASTGAPKPRTSRFERRAEKATQTIREIMRMRKPDLDVEGLSLVDVVERDAEAWGRFLAQVGEWIVPFGGLVDLIFGSPVAILVGLAPSVRAARRDLAARREERKQRRLAQRSAEPEYDADGNLIVPQDWQPTE